MKTTALPPPSEIPKVARQLFGALERMDSTKPEQVRPLVEPHMDVLDVGFELATEIQIHVGAVAPRTKLDETIRDLLCEVFDCLWMSRHLLLRNYPSLSLTLGRRAQEALTLIGTFLATPEKAPTWETGTKVEPREARVEYRNRFPAAIMRDFVEAGKEPPKSSDIERIAQRDADAVSNSYKELCGFAHISRESVSVRFHGQGNPFPCAGTSPVVAEMLRHALDNLLALVVWLVDTLNWIHKQLLDDREQSIGLRALAYRGQVEKVVGGKG